MLMPYTYTIAHEAVDGLPMIRPAVSLQAAGLQGNYEFLYGPSFLIAPIYQNTAMDAQGNDIRNNIYLPEGQWVDWFTGRCYEGGRILNHFDAPLWKLPVFVRRGAIIPAIHAHNNPSEVDTHTRAFYIYPLGHTEFTAYDRLHTNGQKALYPTFVNCGEHPYVEGDTTLMTIRFRAKLRGKVTLAPQDGLLLDKYLTTITW